jgi:pimeloyl-ACP methyl ester carboxylesterase
MRTGRVPGDGLTLAYREWLPRSPSSEGRAPLVLLHGLTGSGADWAPVAARLAAGRRVIALDARGHGLSDWSADAAYAGDAHFADVATALDALGVARCDLAGFSMGGSVAILVAGALPERVARLIVVDAYPAPAMSPGSRAIAEAVAALAMCDGLGFDPAIARRIAEELASGEACRLDLWPFWEALRCPTLLVRGAWSDVLPAPLAAEMLARQPRARLATVPGVGHQIPFQRPRELAELIEDFLDDLQPGGGRFCAPHPQPLSRERERGARRAG